MSQKGLFVQDSLKRYIALILKVVLVVHLGITHALLDILHDNSLEDTAHHN